MRLPPSCSGVFMVLPLILYFHLFNTVDSKQMFNMNLCQWLDSNCGPLVSETTSLPSEPQPLPKSPVYCEEPLCISAACFSSSERLLRVSIKYSGFIFSGAPFWSGINTASVVHFTYFHLEGLLHTHTHLLTPTPTTHTHTYTRQSQHTHTPFVQPTNTHTHTHQNWTTNH